MNKQSLQVGVNLGGWISQYWEFSYGHFDSFIIERDIQQIASWEMDQVRLPVDYPIIESAERPGTLNECGFVYIEKCLEWCQNAGLYLVIDLHKASGYTFTFTLKLDRWSPIHLSVMMRSKNGLYPFGKPSHIDYLAGMRIHSAFEYITRTENSIYCGEFGVIDHAPLQTRINWTRNFIDLLIEHNIGRSIWSFKEMNLALVDANNKVFSNKLFQVASKK